MLWSYYLVQVWPFQGLLSGPCSFVFNTVCQKHCKIGVSTLFFVTKKLRTEKSGFIIWSKFALLKRTQLGPDNNPYLDQIITPDILLFAFKNVQKYPIL